MAPADNSHLDTVSSQLHRCNSDSSKTQAVVREAPLLIVTDPSSDLVSTLKNAPLEGI